MLAIPLLKSYRNNRGPTWITLTNLGLAKFSSLKSESPLTVPAAEKLFDCLESNLWSEL